MKLALLVNFLSAFQSFCFFGILKWGYNFFPIITVCSHSPAWIVQVSWKSRDKELKYYEICVKDHAKRSAGRENKWNPNSLAPTPSSSGWTVKELDKLVTYGTTKTTATRLLLSLCDDEVCGVWCQLVVLLIVWGLLTLLLSAALFMLHTLCFMLFTYSRTLLLSYRFHFHV